MLQALYLLFGVQNGESLHVILKDWSSCSIFHLILSFAAVALNILLHFTNKSGHGYYDAKCSEYMSFVLARPQLASCFVGISEVILTKEVQKKCLVFNRNHFFVLKYKSIPLHVIKLDAEKHSFSSCQRVNFKVASEILWIMCLSCKVLD
ncbi:hypothetical protein HPP92_003031 [Vanilla planifolia]|uniref:Uncharacterized protein n=1 Tax=Vanilla planifolia TaxID=51239 RepID=A0A835VJH7_VANPL|nr:hypothetical protein HPP92_003398 [Vanilla planifolia]KAG0502959.1 hypothetical protein HPP92_003031 [Vanilla planifolia]